MRVRRGDDLHPAGLAALIWVRTCSNSAQVYTGGAWDAPACFHRTLFLFACVTPNCTAPDRFPLATAARTAQPPQIPRLEESTAARKQGAPLAPVARRLCTQYYSVVPPTDDPAAVLEFAHAGVRCPCVPRAHLALLQRPRARCVAWRLRTSAASAARLATAPRHTRPSITCAKCDADVSRQVFAWKHGHKTACRPASDAAVEPAVAPAAPPDTCSIVDDSNTHCQPGAAMLLEELELIIEAEPPNDQYSEMVMLRRGARAVTASRRS